MGWQISKGCSSYSGKKWKPRIEGTKGLHQMSQKTDNKKSGYNRQYMLNNYNLMEKSRTMTLKDYYFY